MNRVSAGFAAVRFNNYRSDVSAILFRSESPSQPIEIVGSD
jgi:hypothetical protein